MLTVSSQVYVPKLKKLEEDKQLWLRKQRAIHGLEMARAVIHQNKSWLDDFSDEQILAGYQKKKLAFSIYNMRESEIVSMIQEGVELTIQQHRAEEKQAREEANQIMTQELGLAKARQVTGKS